MSLKASPASVDRILQIAAVDAIREEKSLDQLFQIADAAQLAFRACIGSEKEEEQQDSLLRTICTLDAAILKVSEKRPSIPTGADGALRKEEQQQLAQLMATIQEGLEE